jgi:hypothetical protein
MFLAIRDSAVFIPFYCTVSRDIHRGSFGSKVTASTAAIGPSSVCSLFVLFLSERICKGNSRQARVGDAYSQERKTNR